MINEKNKDTWCVNAYHAMSGNNSGTTKICCMYRHSEDVSLSVSSIQENFNQPDFLKVREDLENGIQSPHCNLCWEEEAAGRKSKRLRDNDRYRDHLRRTGKEYKGLAILELNLGNTCNLRCRTCAPHSSSQWIREEYDVKNLKAKYFNFKNYSNEMKKYHQTYNEDSNFWLDLEKNLDNIYQLDFYGGEPFMSKKMWRILEILIDRGLSKRIELHYATNGTHWPEEKIKLFEHFRKVYLTFSIDGIGKQFEYMRHPAKWDEVKENMEKARSLNYESLKGAMSWGITSSILNIYSLPEIIEEYKTNYANDFGHFLNLVHGPTHFNISKLPPDVKTILIEKLEKIPAEYADTWVHLPGIINFIKNGKFKHLTWEDFFKNVEAHDKYRGESFAEVFPEWAKILEGAK